MWSSTTKIHKEIIMKRKIRKARKLRKCELGIKTKSFNKGWCKQLFIEKLNQILLNKGN